MQEGPTSGRVIPHESPPSSQVELKPVSGASAYLLRRAEADLPLMAEATEWHDPHLHDVDQGPQRTQDSPPETILGSHHVIAGVCRAGIRPPARPLGEVDDESPVEITNGPSEATSQPMHMEPSERCDSSPFTRAPYSGDHSESADLLLCEPPVARQVMLDLRLPSPIGRRASRTIPRGAADYRADGLSSTAAATLEMTDTLTTSASGERSSVAATRLMPDLPPRGEIALLGLKRTGGVPKRIGSGALAPARLTWMPRDPFGNGVRDRPVSRFRWELMLTAACVTVVGCLAGVWLLRSVFA